MRVSLNEIQVICRKAFEGIRSGPGDLRDAAQGMAGPQTHRRPCLSRV